MSYTKLPRWMTRTVVFAVLVIVLVGWRPGVTSTPVQLPQNKEPSEIKSQIITTVIASSTDARGEILNPGLTFSPNEPQKPFPAQDVFYADLADVRPEPLIKAINKAINELKTQEKCRPPRIGFKIWVPQLKDKPFAEALAQARKAALQQWLAGRSSSATDHLEPDQYRVTSEITPFLTEDTGVVELNFEKFNDQDKDPPKLKDITWNPADGSVVSEGQQIEVTVTASERYEDGHKSWPIGVKSITLVAIGNKVSEWPNPSPESPKPCDRVTWHGTYTVPKTTASTITACAIAEDYAQHRANQCAKFISNLPPPVMPTNCKKKAHAKLGTLDVGWVPGPYDPSKVSCNFRWSICAPCEGCWFLKTKVVKNLSGACEAFFAAERAALPKDEYCCDCFPKCSETKPKPRR